MTEGEKRCGLSSLLPMSCRGRAEAFARRLHSRLRSLGSEDDSSSCASENSWLTTNEISNPAVTSLQPRHTIDNDIFMDFGIDFESPGSPEEEEEEVPESELTKFITNSKDDLHMTNLDECNCIKIPGNSHPGNSVDSDSSDGPYFDPENIDVDNNCTFSNHINGISPDHSTASTSQVSKAEVINIVPSDIPSSSECTVSSLSRTVSDEPIISQYEDSLTDTIAEDSFVPALETQSTSGWKLSYEPKSNGNNNIYSAIDLESLKCNRVNSHVDENKLIINDDLTDTRNNECRRIVDEEERQRLVDDEENQRLVDDEESRRYIDDEVAKSDKESETILYNEDTKILVKDDEENRRLIENEENQLFDNVEDKVIIEDEQQQSIINNEKSRAVCNEGENRKLRDDGEQIQILLNENQDKKEPSSNENINCSLQTEKESYCSHLDIQQNLTVECPNSRSCITPVVQISTLEIKDSGENESNEESVVSEEINKSENKNNLRVTSSPIQNETEENEMEDRIPRVRRCSSLKTGKTPPGTPGRKKIVRFADVLGLDLADVRTFLDEIPKVPTSAYDDLSDADLSLSLSDSSLSSAAPSMNILHTSTKTFVPLFQQPGGEPNFFDKVREQQVCLENAVMQDSEVPCICGTVRVRNLDFNKSVHIRYTIDAWKSFADLQATYLNNSCDGFSDKFSFTLYVHTLTVGQRLDFAVRFQCKGCQYWDNNDGQNYSFQCLPTCTNTPYFPIIAPDDRNWAGAAFY